MSTESAVTYPSWSLRNTTIPDSINKQLIGTLPIVVRDEDNDGRKMAAFFVRAPMDEEKENCNSMLMQTTESCKNDNKNNRDDKKERLHNNNDWKCTIKPQFIRSPNGPLVMVYGMVVDSSLRKHSKTASPFISETAIFPKLPSLPSHKEILDLLCTNYEVFYIICDEYSSCIFNGKVYVLDVWREALAEKNNNFEGSLQITDERVAISTLFWYQQRFKPTADMFNVNV